MLREVRRRKQWLKLARVIAFDERRPGALQHHRPRDQIKNKGNSPKFPLDNGIRAHVGPAGHQSDQP